MKRTKDKVLPHSRWDQIPSIHQDHILFFFLFSVVVSLSPSLILPKLGGHLRFLSIESSGEDCGKDDLLANAI